MKGGSIKKVVFVVIILCGFIAKAEESLYFPILDWWSGRDLKGLIFGFNKGGEG